MIGSHAAGTGIQRPAVARTTAVLRRLVAVGSVAVVLAACEVGSPDVGAPSSSVAIAMPPGFNAGEFSTDLYAPKQGNSDYEWVAEGNRMLEALVLPSDVDVSLTHAVKDGTPPSEVASIPVFDSADPSSFSGSTVDATHVTVLSSAGFKVGVALARGDRDDQPTRQLRVGLYRFTDAAAVSKAIEYGVSSAGPVVSFAAAPEVVARENTMGGVDAFLGIGRMVLHVYARGTTLAESKSLAERMVARQLPVARNFIPTDEASLPHLPLDREGVLARSLGEARVDDEVAIAGSGPSTAVRSMGLLTTEMLSRRWTNAERLSMVRGAGVDLIGWNTYGRVYRARDAGAAKGLREQIDRTSTAAEVPAPLAPAGAGVTCRRDDAQQVYTCRLTVGRYYAEVSSVRLRRAQQMASAQWAILMRNP